ncbi:TolC family protein, partial [Klebsiella pneumoniae]|nr:TolC family protein [Klebsiella pneumoniae]
FITIVSAQRRIEIFDEQVASFDPLIPLLQKRVQEGASSPAETLRAQVAADLFRVERERSKTLLATARRDLAILMGD